MIIHNNEALLTCCAKCHQFFVIDLHLPEEEKNALDINCKGSLEKVAHLAPDGGSIKLVSDINRRKVQKSAKGKRQLCNCITKFKCCK